MTVQGNIKNLSQSLLAEIALWENYTLDKNLLIDDDLAEALADFTARSKRELAVYINRRGKVVYLAIGKDSTAPLQEINDRRYSGILSGLRCIHTHPSGSGSLSDLDISALCRLRLDCMAALGVDEQGHIQTVGLAFADLQNTPQQLLLKSFEEVKKIDFLKTITSIADDQIDSVKEGICEKNCEKAILVALSAGASQEEVELSLTELASLAKTAGIEVVSQVIQNRSKACSATYIGKGKAEEISFLAQNLDADLIIFDDEITPAAQRNLENLIGRKIIDRSLLILDIFAQRAKSNEGKIQVELAQLKYLLPRLQGQGLTLSRLGGGVGTRGPGETKLETDKRKIRSRIREMEHRLDEILKTRSLHRKKQLDGQYPLVALVGYTNSGKSTLLNSLAQAEALAEDLLFATLDPLTRQVVLKDGRKILLSDTVGFIRRLPHHLVAAFRSTLEKVVEADLLLHIVDGSAEDISSQAEAVIKVLGDLHVLDKPLLTVINKADLIDNEVLLKRLSVVFEESVVISAAQGQGLEELLSKIADILPESRVIKEMILPYSAGNILSFFHEEGEILEKEYLPEGIRIKVKINAAYGDSDWEDWVKK